MTRRKRMILALIGLALLAISAAALFYAFGPIPTLSEQTPLLPTLLALPPGSAP
jgi:hypothetical protein